MSKKSKEPRGKAPEKQGDGATQGPILPGWAITLCGFFFGPAIAIIVTSYINVDYGIIRYGFTPPATFGMHDLMHSPISLEPPDTRFSSRNLVIFAESGRIQNSDFSLTFTDSVYAFKCSKDSLKPTGGSILNYTFSVGDLKTPGVTCVGFILNERSHPSVTPSIKSENTLMFGEKAGLWYKVKKNVPSLILIASFVGFLVMALIWRKNTKTRWSTTREKRV